MSLEIHQLHDATLLALHFDWARRECTFEFAGAPSLLEPFIVTFSDVTELVIPATEAWGSSASVLEVLDQGAGRYDFVMQSGDTIRVIAPDNSFKPTLPGGAA